MYVDVERSVQPTTRSRPCGRSGCRSHPIPLSTSLFRVFQSHLFPARPTAKRSFPKAQASPVLTLCVPPVRGSGVVLRFRDGGVAVLPWPPARCSWGPWMRCTNEGQATLRGEGAWRSAPGGTARSPGPPLRLRGPTQMNSETTQPTRQHRPGRGPTPTCPAAGHTPRQGPGELGDGSSLTTPPGVTTGRAE